MAREKTGGGSDPAALPLRPCVGVVLANPTGQVFLAERIDTPGAWQMPQGGIDPGEDPRTAALRELEEEIGVGPGLVTVAADPPDRLEYELPDRLIGKVWKGRWRGQTQRWFLLRFRGAAADITLDVAHPEFSAWRWGSPEDAIKAIVPFKRDIYESVFSYFRQFLGSSV